MSVLMAFLLGFVVFVVLTVIVDAFLDNWNRPR